jgi:AAA ATPase containing von Willebrand factor type A (vWA) domain
MPGPYLKSGETIVLTTDRVLIGDKEYDLILTSHRLALVDSDHARDHPQVLPFATILSVKGGTTPAHEPRITLVLVDPVGIEDSTTLELIFSQQPYEDRSAECETWVRKLIEHIVSDRHESAPAAEQQPAKPQNNGPTVRRWVAPDMPGPHTTVSQKRRTNSEEILSALQNPSWDEEKTRLVVPQDEVPKNEPVAAEEPVKDEDTGNDTLPVEPTEVAEEEISPESEESQPAIVSPDELPEEPAAKPADEVPANEPVPDVPATVQEDLPEIRADEDESGIPAGPEPADTEQKTPVLPLDDKQRLMAEDEQALLGKEPEAAATEEPLPVPPAVPEIRSGLPDTVVFPVLSGQRDPDEQPAPGRNEPDRAPPADTAELQPPSKKAMTISPGGIVAIVIAAIVIAFFAGAVFVLMTGGSHAGTTPLPVTPSVSIIPTATPDTPAIPETGVWVRVTYNGTYYGKYGNPGGLREVRGTGDRFYPITDNMGLVQASFEKLDDSGDTLIVGVYNNGTQVTQVEKRMPRATIAILVDATTGKAPYVPATTVAA